MSKRIWKGKEISEDYRDLRLALSQCVDANEAYELIKYLACWQPGEQAEYHRLMGTVCQQAQVPNLADNSSPFDPGKLDEITFEIRCMGNPPKMKTALDRFVKQYSSH